MNILNSNVTIYILTGHFSQAAYIRRGFNGQLLHPDQTMISYLRYLGLDQAIDRYMKNLLLPVQGDDDPIFILNCFPTRQVNFGGVITDFNSIADLAWILTNIELAMNSEELGNFLNCHQNDSNQHERLCFLFGIMNFSSIEVPPNSPNIARLRAMNNADLLDFFIGEESRITKSVYNLPFFTHILKILEDAKQSF